MSADVDGLVELQRWLVRRVARTLGLDATELDPMAPLPGGGLTVREAIFLAADLERHLGVRVAPSLVWQQPSVREMALAVAG